MKALKRVLVALKRMKTSYDTFKRERPNAFGIWVGAGFVTFILIAWGIYILAQPPEMSLTSFLRAIDGKSVSSASLISDLSGYDIKAEVNGVWYHVKSPPGSVAGDGKDAANIFQALKASGTEITLIDGFMNRLTLFMTIFAPILLLTCLGFIGFKMLKESNASWIKLAKEVTTTFDDVAGAEEAKEELREVLDFISGKIDPAKSKARMPRGVLLSGPPGTGKTLLARALAGAAGTSFISVSGSDFKSMWYGGSSRRVRTLFNYARANKPCIIFIDEFDAIGAVRSSDSDAISKETNGTLNQLLVEMDGFNNNEHILVVAATNFADNLDPAVRRAGRMDRRVEVGLPDQKGRTAILRVHIKGHKVTPDVDLGTVAKGVPGFSGAELENLINEAAIFAARADREELTAEDFEKAKNKIIMGLERRSLVMTPEELRLTAYHEAGHALVACLSPHSDPVHRATIVPHGRALGMVVRLPEGDRVSISISKLRDDMAVFMAGRAAEELSFGKDMITTGASADIEYATKVAREMVTKWGFSTRIGMVKVSDERSANDTVVDEEIRVIIDAGYDRALVLLNRHRNILIALGDALLDRETLSGEEVREIVSAGMPKEPGAEAA